MVCWLIEQSPVCPSAHRGRHLGILFFVCCPQQRGGRFLEVNVILVVILSTRACFQFMGGSIHSIEAPPYFIDLIVG